MKYNFGLSSSEADRLYREIGPNEILASHYTSTFLMIKEIFLDPMGLMLLLLSVIYWLLGDRSDSLVLLVAYVPITAVDVILEIRAQSALRALRSTLSFTAKVIRSGEIQEINIKKLVPGDVIVFDEGQTLPADGTIIECDSLQVNESSLSGESIPVTKDVQGLFFAGTIIVCGKGLGLVEHTAKSTRFGKIASLLEETKGQLSPLQKKVHRLVKKLVIAAAGLTAMLFFIEFSRNKDLLHDVIVALTFGMAAIPEEFPMVYTLYLSMGAWRLSKRGVLVKSLPSVETLGTVDVICTDKTGTLTEGKFQLDTLAQIDTNISLKQLWLFALMACEEKPVDTMDTAIYEKAPNPSESLNEWYLKWDYPFEKHGKHVSHVWENKATLKTIIVMKGAMEGILEHITTDPASKHKILETSETLASQGKRLLGLAYREGPCIGHRETDEQGMRFAAILPFSDPIRSSVQNAIQECQNSQIEIKMVTGDHPLTAHAVADAIGIRHRHDLLFTGDQLAKMPIEQRREAFRNGAIFSRILPEQKYEMVKILMDSGKVVAMTGDGINDAPALKLADIGISMGLNATDVARSAAQMILLKNDFDGVVQSVFEGRRIFANLQRSFSYLVSFHVPVILLALLPPLLGWGDLFMPIHIVILELVVHPISAFSFENLPQVGKTEKSSLLPRSSFFRATLSGLLLSIFSIFLFRFRLSSFDIDSARALAISTILFGNVAFVFVESWPLRTKRFFVTSLCLVGFILFSVEFVPMSRFLHLSKLSFGELLTSLLFGVLASIPSFVLDHFHSRNRPSS